VECKTLHAVAVPASNNNFEPFCGAGVFSISSADIFGIAVFPESVFGQRRVVSRCAIHCRVLPLAATYFLR
jgi:hypothetical protein